MRLIKARVQNYRSIRDTGEFEVESLKTIFVGPNEAGKTAILQALQQLSPPNDIKPFNPIRDYPRALYNNIATEKVKPSQIEVVRGWFSLDDEDIKFLPQSMRGKDAVFVYYKHLDSSVNYFLTTAPTVPSYGSLKADILRLSAHADRGTPEGTTKPHTTKLSSIIKGWNDYTTIRGAHATAMLKWLEDAIVLIDEDNEKENNRRQQLEDKIKAWDEYVKCCQELENVLPKFVLFSNIFRVKPNIHLAHLDQRLKSGMMDDEKYDYGNSCLLKLLGFTAEKLSELGRVSDPAASDIDALEKFREQLDKRDYQLNAASISLSRQIKEVWNPQENKNEASKLKLKADGQYLKVVVEDSEGVEVELDQRSEGFQWLVSFFVVFFAEATGKHQNAILLLDEPGVSLHALKQREFRSTITKLATHNQTVYTTHSPFMVGPDELDLVRVVEMTDREVGTKVHTSITSSDPAALLPLQEALGYDLAQSLFAQQRNLVCEGLTDSWYLEATAALLAQEGNVVMNDKIAVIPSNTAGKVAYFATILTSHNLKVAALLDSDNAGDQAAKQEVLVHRLGAKRILRTSDYTNPKVPKAEIEDLLRDTLIGVAKEVLKIDVEKEAVAAPDKPIIDILEKKDKAKFSKYALAKAYIRWTREHAAKDLSAAEREGWGKLISAINSALK